jgi:hypothetical protein
LILSQSHEKIYLYYNNAQSTGFANSWRIWKLKFQKYTKTINQTVFFIVRTNKKQFFHDWRNVWFGVWIVGFDICWEGFPVAGNWFPGLGVWFAGYISDIDRESLCIKLRFSDSRKYVTIAPLP